MAILMSFQSPDLDILGLTTIYGNVTTEGATRNALLLVCYICTLVPLLHGYLCSQNLQSFLFLDCVHDQVLFLMCTWIV